MSLNILFTSVGRRSYLVEYFKTALNGEGLIHVANSDVKSPAFLVADQSVVTPLIYDKEYIPFLLEYCKRNCISAIISLFDIDLPVLAKSKKLFLEIGTQVIVSDLPVIEVCNDKWKTCCYLKEHDINVPKTYISLQDAIQDIEKRRIGFPLILKPRWGMGSIGIYEVENSAELKIFYEYVKRKVANSYLKYESMAEFENCVLIQEAINGQEYGLDIINDLKGQYITTIVKKKCAMRSGETDCAVTVYDDGLKSTGSKLANMLHHVANLDVDVFVSLEGTVNVLEMNARFGGGYPFSHAAGVDLPGAIVSWLKGEKVDKSVFKEQNGIMAQKDIRIVKL
ncbi:MAG: ATP-grasp domain-containing protein [Lachnospiraceae bacterium]|nr:ATP-grasp domain-containing protein [Lachnospiraceae bacterium]